MTPSRKRSREESVEPDGRKRVGKACDRCRMKKTKCDGQSPCNRCKDDNGVCMYGEIKKIRERIYPKGYCDQMAADHDRLIKCVHTLYEHCVEANALWEYPIAEREPNGEFLTHEILKSMNLLQKVPSGKYDEDDYMPFEDDPKKLFKEFREKEENSRQQQAVGQNEPPTPTSLRGTSMPRHHPMSRTSSHQEDLSDTSVHDPAMPRHYSTSRTSTDHKLPSPTLVRDNAWPRKHSTSSASSYRRPSDTSIRDASKSPKHSSMSGTSSPTSVQVSGPHSMLGPSQQPPHIPLPRFSHAQNGDHVSSTAVKSPGNHETPYLLAMGQRVLSPMNAQDQPSLSIPPQNFSNVAQAPGMYAQAYDAMNGRSGYGNLPIQYTTDPSSYLLDSGLTYGPHQGEDNLSPAIGKTLPVLAQGDEQPLFALQAGLDHQPPLSAFCLAKGYDPNMGFDASNLDIMRDFVM